MGQAFGVPVANVGIAQWANLPKEALQSLWTSYNLLGEGWGLSLAEFKAIFRGAAYLMQMGYTDDHLLDLFNAFDTDANGLVDALEMLVTLALASGMDTVDKIYFVFAIYDFNNTCALSGDECTLMMRSATKGLVKLFPSQAPGFLANTEGDVYADLIFKSTDLSRSSASGTVSNTQFMQYCISHPVISTWLAFSASIPLPSSESAAGDAGDLKVTGLAAYAPTASFAQHPQSQAECLPYVPPEVEEEEAPANAEAEAAAAAEAEAAAAAASDKSSAEGSAAEGGDAASAAEGGEGGEGGEGEAAPAAVERSALDPRTPWTWVADDMMPAEPPKGRTDAPEDSLELVWVHGNSASAGLRNNAHYAYAQQGTASQVIFTASRHAVSLTKSGGGEDGPATWAQKLMSEHQYPIECLALDATGTLLATADRADAACVPINGRSADPSRIVLTSLLGGGGGVVLGSVSTTGGGVRLLSFSANGKQLLAVSADVKNSVTIFDTTTLEPLYVGELPETPLGATFCGTDAIFATAGEAGVFFHVDEGNKFLAAKAYRRFERRTGLLQAAGKAAAGVAATAICRFDQPDETVSATVAGQLLLWHGRSCIQMLPAHRGAVTCLSYNANKKVLASAGKDGTVCLFGLTAMTEASAVAARKGPKLLRVRTIEQTGSFDMMLIFVPSRRVTTLSLHKDGERVLVGTSSGDVLELSLVPTLPADAAAEGGEAAPPAEGEGEGAAASEAVVPMPRLGTDLNNGSIISGHWSGAAAVLPKPMVWGLAKAPGGFVSVGSDGLLCVWSCAEGAPHKLVKKNECDSGLRAVALSASAVAVSMDGSVLPSRQGTVQVFSFPDLQFQAEFKTGATKGPLSILRFSPDGNTLVCAGQEDKIFFYSPVVPEGAEPGTAPVWTLKGSIAHPDPSVSTLALDYAADGAAVRVVDSRDSLGVFDASINIGVPITLPEILKSLSWASNSCPTCWDTKGVFKGVEGLPGADGPGMVAALGAVDRSQHLFVNAGGDSGVMTVTRVPADAEIYTDFPVGKASLPIHCGRVSALCFIEEGTRLVTAGAEDGLIKVWQVAYDTEEPDPVEGGEGEGGDAAAAGEEEGGPVKVIYDSAEEEDWFDGPQLVRHLGTKPPVDRPDAAIAPWLAQVDQSEEGLEAMFKSSKDRLVADELELDWVYGYSSRSTRGTVRYGHGGRIIYPAGCLGVILDKNVPSGGVPTQSYFMGHCDEITCLDLHAASGNVASGHKGTGEITLCVWSSATGATLQRLSCGPVLGLSAVAFSPSGNIVAAACQDEDHTVLIFHWRSGQLQASFKGGPRKVLALTFSLGSTETAQRLLQTGITHFQLADVGGSKGRLVSKKTGLYGAGSKKLTIACAAALPLSPEGGNEFIVALRGGVGVIARGERKLASTVDVFPGGSITALTVVVVKEATADMPPVFRVVAGGRNMEVRLLDGEFGVAAVFNLAKPEYGLTEQGGARGLKSVCVDRTGRKLLYGTSAGEVGEIDTDKGLDINAELPNKPGGPIVRAHYKDQLHAMATHPIRQELATAGDDKSLRVWDMETKALMGQINLPDICRSICWAPNGHILICGLGGVVPPTNDPEAPPRSVPREFDGKVVIVSFLQNVLNVVHIAGDAFEGITSVVYAPDGSKVFCASLDTNIYVYNALDNFKLYMVLKAHSEGVDTLDITADGKCLVSTSVAGEVMLWDVETLEDKPSPAIPDISKLKKPWYMRQGTRNYNSTGIFAPYSKAEAVTALGLSKDERLFVTGDRFGSIFLLRNPSIRLGAPSKRYLAHTPGGVSKTAFSIDDKYVVSIGRTDRCIVQWRLVRSQVEPEVREKEWEAPEIKAKVAGGVATGPFAETFIVTGTSLVTGRAEGEGDEGSEKPDSDGAAAAADAAAAAAALAGATPMDPPSQAHYIGSTNVADTSETLVSLYNNALEQMRRPVSAYVGLGDVLTISGKRLVSLGADRFSQNNWRHAGSAGEAEVSALAVTGCARFVAVGTGPDLKLEPGSPEHEGFKGSLSVLSASSGAVIAVLSPEVPGGVVSVDFSHDNKYLACVAGGTRHAVTVYSSMTGQWNDALLVYAGEGTALKVSSLAFVSPDDADAASSTVRFATAGACSTKFWTVSGRNVTALVGPEHEAAVLEAWNAAAAVEGADPTPLPTPAQTLCLLGLPASALGAGLLLAGADDGSLYLWEGCGKAPRRPLVSHESGAALSAVAPYFKNGTLEGVTSGSRDCVTISTLSRSSAGDLVASPLFSFSTASLYAPLSSAASIAKSVERAVKGLDGGDYVFVTRISPDALGQRVLLSLSCNAVLELSIDSGAVLTITEGLLPRVSVNGIAAHPSEPCTVVTTHGNNCVRVWDLSFPARECVAVLPLTHQPDGVCFLSDTIIAVGICKGDTGGASGGILFLELSAPEPLAAPTGVAASGRVQRGVHRTLRVLSKFHNVGRGQVNCLRPSPSGKFLAAASDDGQVYLYGTDTSSKELGKLSALAGKPVKSVDWSSDGRFLRAFGVAEAGDAVIKSKYFDFEDESDGVASVVRDFSVVQQLRACTWASCSSAGALEARAAHPASEAGAAAFSPAVEEIARQRGSQVTSVCSAGPGAALAVSYNDGTTQLFRSFAVAGAGHRIVDGHSPGPVASTFTASGQLVTLGAQDGCFLVWTLPPAPTPASV